MFSGQQQQDRAAQQAPTPSDRKRPSFLNTPYAWLAVYLLALNIRLWFNFQAPHMNAFGACDASEYLRNAISLHSLGSLPGSFWQDALSCLFGQADQATVSSVKAALTTLNELKISGPVFPTFLIAAFALAGTPFDTSNWMLMLGAQSFIAALTCVLIAHTTALVWDRKVGFCAGILSALYPGFIVNSGRLYSETFAVFLTCFLVWLTVKDFMAANKQEAKPQNKIVWSLCQVIKGFTAICLQLTRSIMVVATAALVPITVITYWNSKSKAKIITALILMTLGYASVAVPCLSLQKLAFGKSSLIVDRVGHYNFFIGNNAATQGWLSVPYPDGRGIEKKSLITLWQEEVKKSPAAWMRLTQDKLPRLLKFPWNDFRTPIGPIGVCQQITIHQLILLLGVIGIVLSLFGNVLQRSNPAQLFCRLMVFSVILFQLVYCFFITVPRYNIAIMPFIIMFAAAGLISLWRLVKNARSTKAAISVIAISIAFFSISRIEPSTIIIPQLAVSLSKGLTVLALAIALWQSSNWLDGNKQLTRALILALLAFTFLPVCLPVRAHGRALEWQRTISADSVRQTINISSQQLADLQKKNCYLLIDADSQTQLVNDTTISVNGNYLSGPFIPSLSFVNDLSHVVPTGNNSVAFEQEYIFDCLTKEAQTANADLRQWFLCPVPRGILDTTIKIKVAANEKPVTVYGTVSTSTNTVTIPSLTRYSWEKAFYGVENTHGLTDTRYDDRLKTSTANTRMLNVFLLADDVQDADNEAAAIMSASSTGNPTREKSVVLNLPAYGKNDLWLIRVTGCARGDKSQAQVQVSISCDEQGKKLTYQSPWCQKVIAADNNWRTFDCAFPIKPSALPGQALELNARFLPVSELYAHRNTSREPITPAEVRSLTVQLLHFPSMPFDGRYQLYLGQQTK